MKDKPVKIKIIPEGVSGIKPWKRMTNKRYAIIEKKIQEERAWKIQHFGSEDAANMYFAGADIKYVSDEDKQTFAKLCFSKW